MNKGFLTTSLSQCNLFSSSPCKAMNISLAGLNNIKLQHLVCNSVSFATSGKVLSSFTTSLIDALVTSSIRDLHVFAMSLTASAIFDEAFNFFLPIFSIWSIHLHFSPLFWLPIAWQSVPCEAFILIFYERERFERIF